MRQRSDESQATCGFPSLRGGRHDQSRLPRVERLGHMDRSLARELLEDPQLPDHMVAQAYWDLDRTHRWLGNTAEIVRLIRQDPAPVRRVLDIGCGQGALLDHIRRQLGVDVIGFDLRPAPASAPVPILSGNAIVDPLPPADVAVSVCLVHHLSEADFIRLVNNVSCCCRRFIVLDLVRHRLPLMLFRTFLAPFLNPLNVADGLTSVRRSYTSAEMRRMVGAALQGTGGRFRHTVAPLHIRQVVDISW
jgi:SAM-dependent methyltransferase